MVAGSRESNTRIAKGRKEILGSDGYVRYFYYDYDFSGVYLCQNLSNYTIK